MTESPEKRLLDYSDKDGYQSAMEKLLIEKYVHDKGYTLSDLNNLPEEDARQIMKEACLYASLKLTQMESTSRLRDDIRQPH